MENKEGPVRIHGDGSDDEAGALIDRALAPLAAQSAGSAEPVGHVSRDSAIAHMHVNLPDGTPLYAAAVTAQAQHPDDAAVDRFAAAMKAKLAQKRAEGRGGWGDKTQCSQDRLSLMLRGHVAKGDPVDVGNFAMMLHQRGERISGRDAASPSAAQAQPVVNQSLTTDEVTNALARMDALLDPASGLLTVPDTSATVAASRADLALIRAALAQQPVVNRSTERAIATAFRDRLVNSLASIEDCYLSRENIEQAAEDVLHSFTASATLAQRPRRQDREDAAAWLDKLINLVVTYGDCRHFEVEATDKRDAADRSAQAFANIMAHARAAKGG